MPVAVWEQFNPQQPYRATSCYKIFYKDTVKYAEVISKRNAYESFYRNPADPSVYSIERSLYPINFQRNGEWIPIDATLRPVDKDVYEAPDQWDPVGIHVRNNNTYLNCATG